MYTIILLFRKIMRNANRPKSLQKRAIMAPSLLDYLAQIALKQKDNNPCAP